jgi:prevent-host-death family protein
MATISVGMRKLKASLSEYVREVKSGGTVIVTERGRPVARLIPEATSIEARVKELVRSGLISWNGEKLPPARPRVKVRGKKTVSDIVIEDRR